ncbi:MAG: hypothetical protein KatS3mg113_0817 [Planctomycetaceae bacterium]|nr:MAG: hypothetical protein KatS3mg113_0817 [Planctomycetaceae bacterium]
MRGRRGPALFPVCGLHRAALTVARPRVLHRAASAAVSAARLGRLAELAPQAAAGVGAGAPALVAGRPPLGRRPVPRVAGRAHGRVCGTGRGHGPRRGANPGCHPQGRPGGEHSGHLPFGQWGRAGSAAICFGSWGGEARGNQPDHEKLMELRD